MNAIDFQDIFALFEPTSKICVTLISGDTYTVRRRETVFMDDYVVFYIGRETHYVPYNAVAEIYV